MNNPIGDKVRTPPQLCLECGHFLDAASSYGKTRIPQPGDVTLCIRCAHVMVFTDTLTLREPTQEEARLLRFNTNVQKMILAIKAIHHD
jgi:hypothetical protein